MASILSLLMMDNTGDQEEKGEIEPNLDKK